MRWVQCDLCGSEETVLRFAPAVPDVPDGGPAFRVVECRGCGLLFLNPRPEGLEMAAFYPEVYFDDLESMGTRPASRSSSLRRLRKQVRRALLERFYGYPPTNADPASPRGQLPEIIGTTLLRLERCRIQVSGREAAIIPFVGEGRLLDVGCGTGKDLPTFIEAGWKVTGVEASPDAASRASKRLDCEILVGDFEEAPLRDGSFDVVRFSHTLEHLPSPRRALERAHRVLRPGGRLFIEVPNAASLERRLFGRHWVHWDLPRHVYHFTPQTLTRLVTGTGFRAVKIKSDGRTRFFTESVVNFWKHSLGAFPPSTKLLSAMARPLAYALGAMNQGGILTVHAWKDHPRVDRSPGESMPGRSNRATP